VNHLMDERRGFRGDDLEDGAGGRADSEISEHIASGNSRHVATPCFCTRGNVETSAAKARPSTYGTTEVAPSRVTRTFAQTPKPRSAKENQEPTRKSGVGGTRAKNQRKERFLTPQSPFGMTILVNSNRDGQKQIPRGARDDRELYFFHS